MLIKPWRAEHIKVNYSENINEVKMSSGNCAAKSVWLSEVLRQKFQINEMLGGSWKVCAWGLR